ncbi:glutaredoxin domain-containing cysteine-rich protein CG12206-like [Anthonomus grandis grandis]|uniref:glutaredoxin domain-containing cysteine-rich protein CG12206-like n=1 Tax=Anthonomus grandis grandis TaxID=2921223 RepID=UPI0021661144|nr:glutaredoxin domain-containing cysteine-rich protein CG12206-like [Anthonomus grandis grandis]
MSEHQEPVTCVPPPLPPKTKRYHAVTTDRDIVISAHSNRNNSTVNLNTVDVNVPGFRELTYSCENSGESHVVKIRISPEVVGGSDGTVCCSEEGGERELCSKLDSGCSIRISVNNNTMVDTAERSNLPHYFFNQFGGLMSSGQISPSDTLDSGTGSDLDGTPPPFMKKKNSVGGVSVTVIGSHKKAASVSSGAEVDSDDSESHSSESSISCDSLNYRKLFSTGKNKARENISVMPLNLLQDIRQRKESQSPSLVDEKCYEERQKENSTLAKKDTEIHSDSFLKFHLNEKDIEEDILPRTLVIEDETFAGYKDLLAGEKSGTIRSAKGTVRGVKNRVRAGIATFLQINSAEKTYKAKDSGKVVVYTTTMGIIRETYQACMKVKQILRTLLIKFEERDVFMSTDYQNEIRERMKSDQILVPQVYIDGQHCGDAETIEKLNESGELRKILKPYKSPDACSTCQVCGGYRLLPCGICNGSKKSVHRNHFTTEFVALKCMNCDENGLVMCSNC